MASPAGDRDEERAAALQRRYLIRFDEDTGPGVFPRRWVLPYWGGNYPISTPGGGWRSFVMEIALTATLVSVILHTATGGRGIGHNAALAVGSTVALLGLFASPISGASMNPARTLGPDQAETKAAEGRDLPMGR